MPSVQVTSACVSPRVKTAEPCVAGQHAHFADRADLVELAAVEAHAALQHFVAEHLLLQFMEDALGAASALGLAFGDGRDQLLEDRVDAAVVFELVANPHGLGERAVVPRSSTSR